MVSLKTPFEIVKMRNAGKVAAQVLKEVLHKAVSGVSLLELDTLADRLIVQNGALPSFKMEKGYHWTTCMCLNNVVVHGIPTEEKLKKGDILCIDLGVYLDGWHADTSWTILIDPKNSGIKANEKVKFLKTGELALKSAIDKCQVGNYIGDISQAMQEVVESSGYSCVRQLVGHGVGRSLHEDPEIPCFVRGEIKNTPKITEGMVLAVEVIYNMGKSPVVYKNDDGWTIVTRDGLPSAVFEHTVAITAESNQVLTSL